jgi:hypothetical protein
VFNWFKKQSPHQVGPDFSDVTSRENAEGRVQRGELEKLFLLPAEFGGKDDPRNVVYVPREFVAIKAGIDIDIIKPLVAEGKIKKYEATPEYQGKSFVPIAIKIVASDPGSFTTSINIWGKASREIQIPDAWVKKCQSPTPLSVRMRRLHLKD